MGTVFFQRQVSLASLVITLVASDNSSAAQTGRSSASSSASLPLASAIHYFVTGGAPSANRGVRRRGYYVLRRTSVPAVLVECGFLTNPTEAAYAQSASYRQKLAEEIAAGVRGRNSVG